MKKQKSIIIILGIFLLVFAVSIIKSNQIANEETISTVAKANLSNKKVGWGIKRANNNKQPDLGNINKKLIDENNDISMGNSEDNYVYLTFDNGYEAGYTETILDVLKNNEVKAAFFITGHYLNSRPELVKRMIDEGHIIGNHIPTSLMSFI